MKFSEFLGYGKGDQPRIKDRAAAERLIVALRHYHKTHEQHPTTRQSPAALLRDASLITKRKYAHGDHAVAADDIQSLL